jgi:3-dehydroquinate synthase
MTSTFQLPSYTVFLGPIEDTYPAWLADRPYTQLCFLTDENVDATAPAFLDGQEPLVIAPGEIHKNLSTCQRIWNGMFDAGLDRKSLMINLGGGVIGDMGGFCAATYKRGIDFIQIPTTLLAMTDASIGGKLGIDYEGLKNTIGVFRDPAAVFVDPSFLKTLSARELTSGFAEVIKHALIGDSLLWNAILAMKSLDGTDWTAILQASIAVKVRVVTEDPKEKGLRALLNFGHTVGHAIESYFLASDAPLTHGEAVATGMICEALTAGESFSRTEEIIPVIFRFFKLRPIPEHAFDDILQMMAQDKKNASGKVRMALPDANPYSLRWLEPASNEIKGALSAFNLRLTAAGGSF